MADATGYTSLQEVAVQYQLGGNSHSSIEVAQLMARSWQQTTCTWTGLCPVVCYCLLFMDLRAFPILLNRAKCSRNHKAKDCISQWITRSATCLRRDTAICSWNDDPILKAALAPRHASMLSCFLRAVTWYVGCA